MFKRPAKALIRLRIWAGRSEPLLVAHTTLLEISCRSSFYKGNQRQNYALRINLSLTGATALCPWARHFVLCLILFKPRKTSPDMTVKLLTERKESNETKASTHLCNIFIL